MRFSNKELRMQNEIQTRFDLNSTADDVVAGLDLSGKLAVITGGAAGIGKETARALASRGAHVIIGGRNKATIEAAAKELSSSGTVLARELDLLSLKSVSQFADWIISLDRPLDVLILNAGIMASPLARSADGIESQLATNFIGHAALASKLAPALLAAGEARVISLSSSAHQMSPVVFDDINFDRRAYDPWEAYGQSKTANALLAVKIWNELGARGVTAHAVHPGGVFTGLMKHVTGDVAAVLSRRYKFDTSKVQVKTIPQGAATTVWAATEPTLLNRPSLYLHDCRVAEVLDSPVYTHGVMRYALDGDNAAALWAAAEKMIGAKLPLGGR
jgi:NAD(P)-dependent dehydrogenase (short-subunit alcohol dehydrogenase family)